MGRDPGPLAGEWLQYETISRLGLTLSDVIRLMDWLG